MEPISATETTNIVFYAIEYSMDKMLITQTMEAIGRELIKGKNNGKFGWHDKTLCSDETLQSLFLKASSENNLPSALTYLAMIYVRSERAKGLDEKLGY